MNKQHTYRISLYSFSWRHRCTNRRRAAGASSSIWAIQFIVRYLFISIIVIVICYRPIFWVIRQPALSIWLRYRKSNTIRLLKKMQSIILENSSYIKATKCDEIYFSSYEYFFIPLCKNVERVLSSAECFLKCVFPHYHRWNVWTFQLERVCVKSPQPRYFPLIEWQILERRNTSYDKPSSSSLIHL